jgi:hypothetical protein
MQLLKSIKWTDFLLSLYRHAARQLRLHVVWLTNRRAEVKPNRRVEVGSTTRFIKVCDHKGVPLSEAADARAAAAAELDPARCRTGSGPRRSEFPPPREVGGMGC